uniref:Uncharacterized protein n=1 Tax=Noctiluca scintillans TaxID=2966 RepID=A0A7S1F6A1_NOCSC|mmetsp:Transcript_36031/g.95674  ORF Transcript_36031/g.95674 Transcript_36031/m.95674 type:complete len:478 (+) Transcript_36031:76-1509(+)
MEKYTTVEGLLSTFGSIAPVRGSYLLNETRLKCRQELPKHAVWTREELEPEQGRCVLFVALSYRWLSKEHSDPDGFHLNIVQHMMRRMMEEDDGDATMDFAMFIDFSSLFQGERTQEQNDLFQKGLRESNVWYASTQAMSWLQRRLPHGFSGAAYEDSGWCFCEAAISSAIKSSFYRCDLSQDAGEDALGLNFRDVTTGRMVPLTPERMGQILDNDKNFTNKKEDGPKVKRIYQEFFAATASETTSLDFERSGWHATHVGDLVEILPWFSNLQMLSLTENPIGVAGAQVLASALKTNSTITSLGLSDCGVGDGGAHALAEALKVNHTIKSLDLDKNSIAVEGTHALTDALKDRPTMEELHLGLNRVGDEGARAIADVLKSNNGTYSTMFNLELWQNGIGDGGALALAAALKGNDTISVDLNLLGNDIGEAGALGFADAVPVAGRVVVRLGTVLHVSSEGRRVLGACRHITCDLRPAE